MEELLNCLFFGGEGCLQEHVFHGYMSAYSYATQNIGKKECCVQGGRCTFDE